MVRLRVRRLLLSKVDVPQKYILQEVISIVCCRGVDSSHEFDE